MTYSSLSSTYTLHSLRTPPPRNSSCSPRQQPRHATILCKASSERQVPHLPASRRDALLASCTLAAQLGLPLARSADAAPAFLAGDGARVEAYLPRADTVEDFYTYKPRRDRTPALRAGTLEPYQFNMPPGWKEDPVANAISGNYCQPRCDEPTTEVKFSNPAQGACQVIIAPLVKLTRQKQPTIDQVGDLDGIIASVGPYITGDFVEPEDVVSQEEMTVDGHKYYIYELDTPYALNGTHQFATVTTTFDTIVLFVVSATDKQFSNSAGDLKAMVQSLRI